MNNNLVTKEEFKKFIEKHTIGYALNLEDYIKYNQHVPIISSELSEMIGAYLNNTLCCGTGVSGWDNLDGGECKHSEHIQSKFCGNCENKVIFFRNKCNYCDSEMFKANKGQKTFKKTNPRDGRWGIDAGSHIKNLQQLKEYRLSLLEPIKDVPDCREFRYRYWVMDKNSEHLNNYAKAQKESNKSDHINFQPLKEDFYLSKPIKKIDGKLIIHKDRVEFITNNFDLTNTVSEEIPEKFKNSSSESKIESKKFGKERGETGRIDIK